jgi:hypothetical protein
MSQKYPGGFITKSPVTPAQGIASGIWTLEQAMQLKRQGQWPPLISGAPTIGTATATGSTTATVVFTAPTSNGGSAITSYTATSSPGGITGTLNQSGSGTITVSGLSPGASYTFTVTATNAVGTSAASAASNSITTSLPAIGSAFGGGFFVGQISTTGNSVATHNLIVGPKASAENGSVQYKVNNSSDAGTASFINGPSNSASINDSDHPAAQFCEGLSIGGFSDWYLPAYNELEVCYYNLKPSTEGNTTSGNTNVNAVPARASNYSLFSNPSQTSATDFQTGGAEAYDSADSGKYWNSTQTSAFSANRMRFSYGLINGDNKYASLKVRAVRRVAV